MPARVCVRTCVRACMPALTPVFYMCVWSSLRFTLALRVTVYVSVDGADAHKCRDDDEADRQPGTHTDTHLKTDLLSLSHTHPHTRTPNRHLHKQHCVPTVPPNTHRDTHAHAQTHTNPRTHHQHQHPQARVR